MNEYLTLYQITGAGIALVLASFLYSLGGRDGKWKRRFIASLVLATTVITCAILRHHFSWWMLFTYPLLTGGFSLGYGADEWEGKVIKRTIYAAAVCMAGVLMAFLIRGNAFWILPFHIGVGAFSVYLGTKNPIEAAAEEFIICMILNIGLITYCFV
jgi:hypothetical protein